LVIGVFTIFHSLLSGGELRHYQAVPRANEYSCRPKKAPGV
jgi:hypothetical protein